MTRSEANDIRITALEAENERLKAALRGITEHYIQLVNSGDAGSWDGEKEPEVIAARQALGGPHDAD